MKTFIACLGTETNTFSPMPTGWRTFEETVLYHGDATQHPPSLFSEPLHVWRRQTEERQGQVVESVCAFAEPSGTTVRGVYESLRDEMLDDLRNAMPVDMVLLNMHGAMVADGYDDCEGDMLTRIREIVGPDVAIGGELDLHCSVTPKMIAAADALITFKEYPHIDAAERAAELFDLCAAKQAGAIKPVMATYDCRMMSTWRTPTQPMEQFVADMQAAEGQDGILAVSFAHGFPWGDVPYASAKMLVVADGDTAKAEALAKSFGERLWAMREDTRLVELTVDQALDRLEASDTGPMVLADVSDNAGGGAPSDNTVILRALLERGIGNVSNGYYWDPQAVRFCVEAGEGARLDLRIGGKCGPASSDPVDLTVTVKRIVEGAHQSFGGARSDLGTAVWVATDNGIDLILNTARTQVFNPDGFLNLGLDLSTKRAVVVKSTQHFYAGFEPLASEILYVAAPGAIHPDMASIPFKIFTDPFWPKVDNPFED